MADTQRQYQSSRPPAATAWAKLFLSGCLLACLLMATACERTADSSNANEPAPHSHVEPAHQAARADRWRHVGHARPDPARVIAEMKLRWVPGLPEGNWRVTGRGGWVGIYEVTQREYLYTTGTNHSIVNDLNLPMINVSFNDATGFCRILNAERERQGLPGRYRLPTLEQWLYIGGRDVTQSEIGIVRHHMPVPVEETLPAGDYGIRGLGGNVSEWVTDGDRMLIVGGDYSSGFVPTDPSVINRPNTQPERTGFRVVLVGDHGA